MTQVNGFCDAIRRHYSLSWSNDPNPQTWNEGPANELPLGFCILEFGPTEVRKMWTYATCCMSHPSDMKLVELHMFSPIQCDGLVELLTVVAHYHRTGRKHTVNFGRPWLDKSTCEFGLISLPYLDGPRIEQLHLQHESATVNCLWLVPITEAERNYKKSDGLKALECKVDEPGFNYLNPLRPSGV